MADEKKPVLYKFFALNSKPNAKTFPELPTVILWVRFILATGYGTWLGMSSQKGAAGVMFGLNFIAFVPILYCNTVRNVVVLW